MLPAAATEQMPQFFLLRLQVFFRVFRGRDLAWYTLGYLDTGAFERSDFIRIIRQQANLVYVQRLQDLDWHEELALVGLEAKALIRFHRVKSAVLERVGLQFRHQPNAAALLLLIDQDACPQVSDHGECHFQLLAAVAAQRAKYVAGQTLGVDAHQRRPGVHLTHHQRYRLFRLGALSRCRRPSHKPVNQKMSPARRKVRGRYLFYL